MPIHKLRELDRTTVGVSLPKDELEHDGFVDEDGAADCNVLIQREGEGEFSVKVLGDD